MEPKQKPYITKLEEKCAVYKEALDAFLEWTTAEEKVNNTAYKRDAEIQADIAKKKALQAIDKAKAYEGG